MMFLWAISAVPFGVYAIIQNFAIPIQIQPQIFCALSLFTWTQILVYNNGYTTWKASLLSTTIAVSFGGVEALLVFTLRPLYDRGIAWPLMIVGVVAAILLAAGLLPPYFEMWKRQGRVVGIHFGFLTVDWLGAFFSLMGVIAQETFDPLGGCLFIVWYVGLSLPSSQGSRLFERPVQLTNILVQRLHRRRHFRLPRYMAPPNSQTPQSSQTCRQMF